MNRLIGRMSAVETTLQCAANLLHRTGKVCLEIQTMSLDPLILWIMGALGTFEQLANIALMLVQVGEIEHRGGRIAELQPRRLWFGQPAAHECVEGILPAIF